MKKWVIFSKQNVSFLSIVSFFIEKCVIFVDCVIILTECVIVSRNIKLCHYDTKCVSLAALVCNINLIEYFYFFHDVSKRSRSQDNRIRLSLLLFELIWKRLYSKLYINIWQLNMIPHLVKKYDTLWNVRWQKSRFSDKVWHNPYKSLTALKWVLAKI